MEEENKARDNKKDAAEKRPLLRKAIIAVLFLVVLVCAIVAALLINNNISFSADQDFQKRLDAAIEKSLTWTQNHRETILKKRNIALIKMLREIETLSPTPLISDITGNFMATPTRPRCWKRLIDPNWPVDETELNITIKRESLDNKWVLYAIAPDKAKVTPEELGMFDPERWQQRKLTHQLDALLMLSKTTGPSEDLDKLIEHLCHRLSKQLTYDIAVVDIYIQKVTFILRAGFPQEIRRRWVERIIANQLPDGGWNDRWLCLTSDSNKPIFALHQPASDQHATLQALTMLYLVRYKYPEHFGLK
jgi:hypothetical protein